MSTITFCRSSTYRFTGYGKQLALLGMRFASLHTLFSFGVQLASYCCGSSFIGQRKYFHLPLGAAIIDIEQITVTHMARRLAALAIDFDFSALDRFCGQRSRLEKARCPAPFIDSYKFVIRLHNIFCYLV